MTDDREIAFALTFANTGNHTIREVDAQLGTVFGELTLDTIAPPIFDSTPVTTAIEDSVYTYSLSATSPPFPLRLDFRAQQQPTWAELLPSSQTSAILQGIPSNTNFSLAESVVLTIFDGVNPPVLQSFTINVTNINDAPEGGNKSVTKNEDSTHTFKATDFKFTDPKDVPANAFSSVRISSLPARGVLKLNGVAVVAGQEITVANINAGLLKFTPALNSNGNAYSSFTFQVRDNGGKANGGVNLDPSKNRITFNITPVNDIPIVSLPNSAVTYIENAAPLLIFSVASVSDVDNPSILNCALTIRNTNSQSTDRLAFIPNSKYKIVGNKIKLGSTVAAKFTGGSGNVGVTPVNDAPVVTVPTTPLTYVENAAPLAIFTGATVSDAENAKFTNGVLTVRNTNGQAVDTLSILTNSIYKIVGSTLTISGSAVARARMPW